MDGERKSGEVRHALAAVVGGHGQLRARRRRQLARARREVRVDVRFEDVRDAEASRFRELEIDVDVAARIDDRRHSRALAGDDV